MNREKTLVIISGVTGAIGSAILAEYAKEKNNVIYGISRKALPIESFLNNGKLPPKTLICSIGESLDFDLLFRSVEYSFKEVIYIHALGLYPFEVNSKGKISIEKDFDKDGVNDEVTKLTYQAFVSATQRLEKHWKGRVKCIIFGGIADKYRPDVHQSWWKTIEKVKEYMRNASKINRNVSMVVFNISSVLCPHEIVTRPFVFANTDADQTYWLSPYDLARFVVKKISRISIGFHEFEKYKVKPNFKPDIYYNNKSFTPRKVKELY